ncbi:MAG: tetratricopeptide repeat protein [Pseudomonadota bacterium]
MYLRATILIVSSALLTACSMPQEITQDSAQVQSSRTQFTGQPRSQQSELLYHMLVAEMASRRGQLDVAYESYIQAADISDDPELAESAARIAIFGKAWARAARAGERWLALEPHNSEARHVLVTSYLRLKRQDAAQEQLIEIVNTHPDGVEQGAAVAYALLRHETNEALTTGIAQELSNVFSQSPGMQFNLARLAHTTGDRQLALQAIDRTLMLQPDLAQAILLRAQLQIESGNPGIALTELRAKLEQAPTDLTLNLGYARLLVQSGAHEEAVQAMAHTYTISPGNPTVVLSLGLMALEAHRLPEAKGYLNRVLDLGHRESEAHYYLARIADSQSEYETAIDHYSKVVSNDLQLDAQTRITELMALLGHVDQARFRIKRLRELNPGVDRQVHFILLENKILRETGHHQEAFDMLTDSLEAYPENIDVLYARALAAEKIGLDGLFEEHMRTVLSIEPQNARALNALGYFLADQSRQLDEAELYIMQAIALMPTDPAVIDSLGWLNYRQGKYEEALRLLKQAYQLLYDPEIAAHLGEVLWVSGDQASAIEIWDDALKQSPDDALLKEVIQRFRE